MSPLVPPKKLSEEEVVQMRSDKIELNRHSRRQTGMKKACAGKTQGLLECETPEGKCPDYAECND
jgi:hypothetical protein